MPSAEFFGAAIDYFVERSGNAPGKTWDNPLALVQGEFVLDELAMLVSMLVANKGRGGVRMTMVSVAADVAPHRYVVCDINKPSRIDYTDGVIRTNGKIWTPHDMPHRTEEVVISLSGCPDVASTIGDAVLQAEVVWLNNRPLGREAVTGNL